MNLSEIETKCFILALFIRDDGLRFLLGTGAYEFKDSQLHFAGNTIENDVVSVQGNDGYLLAGQVRRPSTQVFDGYIGDASVNKSEIEGYRRDFFAFFRKNHFYTVVYVMPDGTAIQRRRGFLVDAPTVKELWQLFPEYHIGLNFEDINYYDYSENSEGEETYGKSADIGLAKAIYGGLIWDESSSTQVYNSGTDFSISGTEDGKQVDYIDLYGDTQQQTYTGKNLLNIADGTYSHNGITATVVGGKISLSGTASGTSFVRIPFVFSIAIGDSYTLSANNDFTVGSASGIYASIRLNYQNQTLEAIMNSVDTSNSITYTSAYSITEFVIRTGNGISYPIGATIYPQLEVGMTPTTYEPYVGGMASPNPDYPQEVKTVTGEQTITVSNGQGTSQDYTVNLGKNLMAFTSQDFTISQVNFKAQGGSLYLNGTSNAEIYSTNTNFKNNFAITLEPGTYTLSGNSVVGGSLRDSNDTTIASVTAGGAASTFTITSKSTVWLGIYVASGRSFTNNLVEFQIEKGSTATTYAPYFTPIELCKIGDYQDYIYSVNGDWYLHKETAKVVLNGTENWTQTGAGIPYTDSITDYALSGNTPFSDYFSGYTNQAQASGLADNHIGFNNTTSAIRLWVKYLDKWTTGSAVATWLTTHPTNVYYALRTATDTQITNATLISELETLNTATTYDDITWFRSESTDLPAIVWVYVTITAGGGVVWDANGAEWEDGGGGEATIVTVDSIDTVLPVWTVTGKATNPTLTNLTTGMSISYTGTIAQGQTLVVDLLNKTAKLNGTSVISGLTGQWVEFIPGNNRVSYSTDNSDAPDSKIEWQEVVG